MIALGTVMASAACSGPQLPYKGGRIDALEAGSFGVPEPSTNITQTLAEFGQAGFSQVEAIQLTACGHTVGQLHGTADPDPTVNGLSGHVHNGGFPTVVGPSAITPNNTGGGVPFDDTFTIFDNHV